MARISAAMKEQVRGRLLETAAAQFAEKGLDGTNVDSVAVGAGFGKGTVYNYFASKEELFAEVLAEGCRQAVQRYASVPREGSVRDCLLALAAADVAVLREEEQFMKVVIREAMSFRPQTYPLIVGHLAPYVGEVEKVLARGRASREIRSDLPAPQLALVFVGHPRSLVRPALGLRWRVAHPRRDPTAGGDAVPRWRRPRSAEAGPLPRLGAALGVVARGGHADEHVRPDAHPGIRAGPIRSRHPFAHVREARQRLRSPCHPHRRRPAGARCRLRHGRPHPARGAPRRAGEGNRRQCADAGDRRAGRARGGRWRSASSCARWASPSWTARNPRPTTS